MSYETGLFLCAVLSLAAARTMRFIPAGAGASWRNTAGGYLNGLGFGLIAAGLSYLLAPFYSGVMVVVMMVAPVVMFIAVSVIQSINPKSHEVLCSYAATILFVVISLYGAIFFSQFPLVHLRH